MKQKKNLESLETVTHTHTHNTFTKEIKKAILNKIANILVEKNNIKNLKKLKNIKYINNIKDRLFLNKKIACPF